MKLTNENLLLWEQQIEEYERMHEQLLSCSVIMSDETSWQVNHEGTFWLNVL